MALSVSVFLIFCPWNMWVSLTMAEVLKTAWPRRQMIPYNKKEKRGRSDLHRVNTTSAIKQQDNADLWNTVFKLMHRNPKLLSWRLKSKVGNLERSWGINTWISNVMVIRIFKGTKAVFLIENSLKVYL